MLLLRLLFKSKQGLCLAQIGSHTATPAADRGMNLRWGSCTQGRVTAAGPPLLPKHPYHHHPLCCLGFFWDRWYPGVTLLGHGASSSTGHAGLALLTAGNGMPELRTA